ncbi:hypothetical protein [Pseudalkalibacillus salsuginis]|uniref:hypothetical protein n=1 Tax=Pseudalkalibacillus salsuginis TaxID=2910972 RepID=UPI001F345C2F|nr:hypothetical protein [Pseudalkalibacillus salsuginis]MCF6410677.1 hypothetical protein [Pseudalkalibacillus salsuginis]
MSKKVLFLTISALLMFGGTVFATHQSILENRAGYDNSFFFTGYSDTHEKEKVGSSVSVIKAEVLVYENDLAQVSNTDYGYGTT